VLGAGAWPISIAVSRIYAGHDYDPYVFSPHHRAAAQQAGRPSFPGGAQVLAEFERDARRAAKAGPFLDAQAFVRPFLVMCEGRPRFPMLVGTGNAVHWYAHDPRHRMEFLADWGLVSEGDVVIDCGAHAGQLAGYFSAVVGPAGRVIAIDPFAQNCLQIETQARLNPPGRIRVVKAAAGARRGTLQVSNRSQMTTIIDGTPTDDLVTVDVVPLDDFQDDAPTLIKLDIEGAEVDALAGAAGLISTCRPQIFIEAHTHLIGQFGYGLADLFSRIPSDIYDISFQVEGVDRTLRRYQPGLEAGITAPLFIVATPRRGLRERLSAPIPPSSR
jgi:FkbM family methyltransferase